MLETVSGSSPRGIRQKNVMAALRCLHSFGPMSRAELARKLGLNRSSSGQIVADLTESGFVREVAVTSGQMKGYVRAGRPGIKLEIIPDAAFFLGIEIGVEHISSVVIDLAGQTREHRKKPFNTPAVTIEQALDVAFALALENLRPDILARCQGLGISIPAHLTTERSIIFAPFIGWRDVPLAKVVRERFPHDLPIMVENDANAFAIGDSYRHGPSGVTLFLVMETGVGGGILIDGKLFRGGHGLAGEIGHLLVPVGNAQKQALERLIGRDKLIALHRAACQDDQLDLQDFLDAVRDRVPSAVEIAEDWSRHLAYALLQACNLIDPERIVLGGSVAPLFELVSARVKAHMAAAQSVPFPSPNIIVDENAEFGSAFGAACLMHRQFLLDEGETTEKETP